MDQFEVQDRVPDPLVAEIIICATGEAHSSQELLAVDRRGLAELRTAYEDAILAGQPIARCAACHQPVKPRLTKKRRRAFWHYKKNANCPYQVGGGLSQRTLDAMRYNGQKEGDAHRRLKQLLTESLAVDLSFERDTLAIEQRWWGVTDEGKWRTPDVSIVRGGVRFAFEVQLSSTYLNVMRERHRFYLHNGGLLIWIFREAQTINPRQMQDDIFYWNNSNLFVVDNETRQLSVAQGELVLRCHYLVPQLDGPEQWHEQLVHFSELTLDLSHQRVYYYDNAMARQAVVEARAKRHLASLRDRYIALWTRPNAGSDDHEFCHDYAILASELDAQGIKVPDVPDNAIKRFTWLCLSASVGTPVGFGHKTLVEVANYAFTNCPELVHYFLAVAKRANTTQALLDQDDSAGAKKRGRGKSHESWRDRIPLFRESYSCSRRHETGPYPIEQRFDSLLALLFPAEASLALSSSTESKKAGS